MSAEAEGPLARNLWGEETPLEPSAAAEVTGATPATEDMAPDQNSLFDLDALTVRAPDADINEEMDDKGYSVAARLKVFEENTIKQMVCYFRMEEYRGILERMEPVMRASKAKDHTRAFLYLLEHWESRAGQPAKLAPVLGAGEARAGR